MVLTTHVVHLLCKRSCARSSLPTERRRHGSRPSHATHRITSHHIATHYILYNTNNRSVSIPYRTTPRRQLAGDDRAGDGVLADGRPREGALPHCRDFLGRRHDLRLPARPDPSQRLGTRVSETDRQLWPAASDPASVPRTHTDEQTLLPCPLSNRWLACGTLVLLHVAGRFFGVVSGAAKQEQSTARHGKWCGNLPVVFVLIFAPIPPSAVSVHSILHHPRPPSARGDG